MQQFRGVKVHVQSGSATVRQVYRANISATNGIAYSPNPGEAVTWSGGAGFLVSENGSIIEFYRTSGSNPAVGSVIDGNTSNAQRTIGSFPSENLSVTSPVAAYPAAFATSATQGAIATNDEFFITGQPVGYVSGTIGSDSFDLISAWAGTSPLTNVECVINRERTSVFGWPIPIQGSRLWLDVLAQALRQIDEDLNAGGGGGGTPPSAFASLTLVAPWQNVPGYAVTAYSWMPGTDSVQIQGMIDTNGSTVSSGSVIVSSSGLPTGRRPLSRQDFSFGAEWFSVHPNGSITFETYAQTNVVPGYISLSCGTFRADGS